MDTPEPAEFEQPNLRAEFFAGPLDGWICYFAYPRTEFCMIIPVRDAAGQVVKKQAALYRLARKGAFLEYRFVQVTDREE